jgi:hypothetical protein
MLKNIIRYRNISGFSGLELMGVLVVVAFIILFTSRILESFNKNKEYRQIADQARQFRMGAIRYLSDNYRTLVLHTRQTDRVISYMDMKYYLPNGVISGTKYYQMPCLYVTRDGIDSIRAYLIFGSQQTPKMINYLTLASITKSIGGNSGVLVKNNEQYIIKGSISDGFSLPATTISMLSGVCGFRGGLATNSLIINLTRDRDTFLQIQHKTDRDSTKNSVDPSLKKTESGGLATMQTNLYLDEVIKESTTNEVALHRYLALDFGNSRVSPGRIQLRSNAPQDGVASRTSQLNVSNAGLQAGYIAPMSRVIQPGGFCQINDLGKMAQQLEPYIKGVGGQLQCTYNPTFCGDTGYCYLPVKTSTVLIHYRPNVRVGICPSGSRVSEEQPAGNIDREHVLCGGVINPEVLGCYRRNYTNITFCSGYQTICIYRDERGNYQRVSVPALKVLLCTTATAEYMIDGYRPG